MMKYLEMNIKSKTRCTVSVFGLYRVSAWGRLFLPSRCRLVAVILIYFTRHAGCNIEFEVDMSNEKTTMTDEKYNDLIVWRS